MKVSVIIPVFNAERYVEAAIDSCVHLRDVGEVLLIDDGSTDQSLHICRLAAERYSTVRILQHPGGINLGAGATRNLGISASRCEYVSFLDADDLYLENRFSLSLRILDLDPAVDGTYGDVGTLFEDAGSQDWWISNGHPLISAVGHGIAPADLGRHFLTHGTHCHTNGITVRRALFERSGVFDKSLKMGQDTHLWIRMAMVGRLVHCGDTFLISMRRLHSTNRIYQFRGLHHSQWRVKLYDGLATWSRSHAVDREIIRLIDDACLQSRIRLAYMRAGEGSRHSWRFEMLRQLTTTAISKPGMILKKKWWNSLFRSVGLESLKRRLG